MPIQKIAACVAVAVFSAAAAFAVGGAAAETNAPDPADWPAVLAEARGQTVYWHAWGGKSDVNAYKAWVGDRVAAEYGVTLVHVKLAATADAVSRVLAEKAAGKSEGGEVDLIWLNGPNFASMKRSELLFGPWAEQLPNFELTAPDQNPGVRFDFTVPTDGLEAPYGSAQLVFIHDAEITPEPPKTLRALAAWAEANPGRFTYPAPPDFLGSTFLKQALIELTGAGDALSKPVEMADYDALTAPLWAYLEALHPHLWRKGRIFPGNGEAMRALFGDGEVDITFDFDPGAASAGIAAGRFAPSSRTFVLDGGTIGNVNFVAIPFNASAKAGAMVVANFLLSPEAQARKVDPAFWGAGTVLDMGRVAPEERALFEAIDLGPGGLPADELGTQLPEPHPSWMTRLEDEWRRRYGAQ